MHTTYGNAGEMLISLPKAIEPQVDIDCVRIKGSTIFLPLTLPNVDRRELIIRSPTDWQRISIKAKIRSELKQALLCSVELGSVNATFNEHS